MAAENNLNFTVTGLNSLDQAVAALGKLNTAGSQLASALSSMATKLSPINNQVTVLAVTYSDASNKVKTFTGSIESSGAKLDSTGNKVRTLKDYITDLAKKTVEANIQLGKLGAGSGTGSGSSLSGLVGSIKASADAYMGVNTAIRDQIKLVTELNTIGRPGYGFQSAGTGVGKRGKNTPEYNAMRAAAIAAGEPVIAATPFPKHRTGDTRSIEVEAAAYDRLYQANIRNIEAEKAAKITLAATDSQRKLDIIMMKQQAEQLEILNTLRLKETSIANARTSAAAARSRVLDSSAGQVYGITPGQTTGGKQVYGISGSPGPSLKDNLDLQTMAFQNHKIASDKYNKSISDAIGPKKSYNQITQDMRKAIQDTTGTLNSANGAVENHANYWHRFAIRMIAITVAYKALSAIISGIKDANELLVRLGEIQTVSQRSQQSLGAWSDQVRGLSDTFGQSQLKQAEGMYQTISNQVAKGAEATMFMNEANKLAVITVSSVDSAVQALTGVLNAYGMSASQSSYASAVLFKTVELGRVRLDQMGLTLGNLMVVGAELNITLEELAASIALITIKGVTFPMAATQMRNVMMKLISPSDAMKKTFKEWGVESGPEALQTFGLVGVFDKLLEKVKTSTDLAKEMGKEFKNIRAVTAGITIGGNIKEFKETLKDIKNSEESAAKATELMFNNPGFRNKREWERLKNVFIDLGVTSSLVFDHINTKIVSVTSALKFLTSYTIGPFYRLGEELALPFIPEENKGIYAIEQYKSKHLNAALEVTATEERKSASILRLNTESANAVTQVWMQAYAKQRAGLNEMHDAQNIQRTLGEKVMDIKLKAATPKEKEELIVNRLKELNKEIAIELTNKTPLDAAVMENLISKFEKYANMGPELKDKLYFSSMRTVDNKPEDYWSGFSGRNRETERVDKLAGRRSENINKQWWPDTAGAAKGDARINIERRKYEQMLFDLQKKQIEAHGNLQDKNLTILDKTADAYRTNLDIIVKIKEEQAALNKLTDENRSSLATTGVDLAARLDTLINRRNRSVLSMTPAELLSKDQTNLPKFSKMIDYAETVKTIQKLPYDDATKLELTKRALKGLSEECIKLKDIMSPTMRKSMEDLLGTIGKYNSNTFDYSSSTRSSERNREMLQFYIDKTAELKNMLDGFAKPATMKQATDQLKQMQDAFDNITSSAIGKDSKKLRNIIALQKELGNVPVDSKGNPIPSKIDKTRILEVDLDTNEIVPQRKYSQEQLDTFKAKIIESINKVKELNTQPPITVPTDPTGINNINTSLDSVNANLEYTIQLAYTASAALSSVGGTGGEGEFAWTGGRFASGGLASDQIQAMLSRGEFVVNSAAARRNMPRLVAMNAGLNTGGTTAGSSTTNVGDINITLQGGNNTDTTVRQIGEKLRREIRRGTLRLN